MKPFLILVGLCVTAFSSYAADTSLSIQVGQPGFYGRIDIGDFPRPQVIYTRPVVIEAPRTRVVQEPVYLHVPPGHAKHWSKHCKKYNACGRPVYFVREQWYNDVYVPQYNHRGDRDSYDDHRQDDHDKGKHENDRGRGHGQGRNHR